MLPFTATAGSWYGHFGSARFAHLHDQRSRFFNFSVDHDSLVRIEGNSQADDFHLSLLSDAGKDGAHIRTKGRVGTGSAERLGARSFEEAPEAGEYTVEVRTNTPVDAGFDLTITRLNWPPVFAQSAYTFSIPENSPSRTLIGQVSATDPDSDALGYSLQGLDPTLGAPFFIDYNGGEIFVAKNLDYETEPTETLTAVVTINVTDVPE